MTEISEVPPTNNYQAADWLLFRHEWARQNVARVVGREPLVDDDFDWLDALADAWADLQKHDAAWAEYSARVREPRSNDDEWEMWRDAGPHASPAAHELGVMSPGEQRIMRLLATLHPTKRVEWSMSDLDGLDERGGTLALEWVRIVARTFSHTTVAYIRLGEFVHQGWVSGL